MRSPELTHLSLEVCALWPASPHCTHTSAPLLLFISVSSAFLGSTDKWEYTHLSKNSICLCLISCNATTCYLFTRLLLLLSRFSRVRLFATPWTAACQAPLSMRFSRKEYWSGLPRPPPGIFPTQGLNPCLPASPALQADSLPTETPGKSHISLVPVPQIFRLTFLRVLLLELGFLDLPNKISKQPLKFEFQVNKYFFF